VVQLTAAFACNSNLRTVDGLRLDSIFNVNKDFWSGFNHAAGVFCLGEGITNNAMTLCPLQNNVDGVLDYPMFV